jgi:predicted CopG family antitoxin
MKRLLIQLPEEDISWLKTLGKSESKSVSQIMRELVTSKRKKHERSKSPEQY